MSTPPKGLSRRGLLQGAIVAMTCAVCGLAWPTSLTAAPSSQPTTRPASRARDTAIQKLEAFYAKAYGEPLDSAERLPRGIAIVSLSRIDAEPVTERLLGVFKAKDKDPVVQYLAWEALHARHASLSPEQRSRWAAG